MSEQKKCKNCGEEFEISDEDLEFYQKMTIETGDKRFSIPSPTFCPSCRSQRRLAYRNDRTLYKGKCAMTGEEAITMFNPERGYTIYEAKSWWSDKWDPLTFGIDYDESKSVFEQYKELQKKVPRFNLFNVDSENCDYVNYAPHCKNCYLLFGSWFNENCYYGQTLNECKDSFDSTFLDKSELCYGCIDSDSSYSAIHCQNCSNTRESVLCFDCHDVSNCLYCYNLKNKQYHINNKPATKEEYEAERKKLSSYLYLKQKEVEFAEEVKNVVLHKFYVGLNNENVSGNFIFNCKNTKRSFSVYRNEDVAYCARMLEGKDSYDFDGGGKSELTLENMSNDFSYLSIGCTTCEHMKGTHYSDLCFNCENCFGCVGLRKKQYCILNKQYTKDEYEKLLAQIIERMISDGEWGEFPPVKNSPFALNETMAQEYFPITKEEAVSKGYNWQEIQLESDSSHSKEEIPDDIKDVDVSILQKVLTCEESGRSFKIIPHELDYLKKMGLPIPRLHPDERHNLRMQKRNPRQLWKRQCMCEETGHNHQGKCPKEFETTYAPDRKEKVYCEVCYQKSII